MPFRPLAAGSGPRPLDAAKLGIQVAAAERRGRVGGKPIHTGELRRDKVGIAFDPAFAESCRVAAVEPMGSAGDPAHQVLQLGGEATMLTQPASTDRASVATDDAILSANERYAATFAGAELKSPPRRRFAVVTCMDARLDPARFLGLEEGDAHVIRNAGGVVSEDALRSLIVSHWMLGTRHVYVIGHTDCGMAKADDDGIRARLEAETGEDASGIEFLTFSKLEQAVSDSVARIRASRLLPEEFGATGYVYEVATGRLRRVS